MKPILFASVFAAALVPLASHAATGYATVISSTPVMATVDVPRRVCSEAEQYVQPRPSGVGAVIGAIAGGVIGNNFGGGFGRAAATGIGAVAGAAIGNSVEGNAYPPAVVPVQRCEVVGRTELRPVGYDVVYQYAGERYTTRLARDPGRRLAIDVQPAGAVPFDRYGPALSRGAVAPSYVEAETAYVAPAPVYYAPAPVYYGAPAYVGPSIGVGIGTWGRHRGHHWH